MHAMLGAVQSETDEERQRHAREAARRTSCRRTYRSPTFLRNMHGICSTCIYTMR